MSHPLTVLLQAIPLPAIVVDQSEHIAAENDEAVNLLGEHIHRHHYATILRQPPILESIEACLQRGTQYTSRFLTNDGQQDITYIVTCRYISEIPSLSLGCALVIFQDITQLEQADQMRREFVANVSHELRSPLTALSGFIETLRGHARDDPANWVRFLDFMEVETGRMTRLVGDLLSLSRVESYERVRPEGQVDIVSELQSTFQSLKLVADEMRVTLNLTVSRSKVDVTGDCDQLQQVFSNLIENAIKYGGSGGVVNVSVAEYERDTVLLGPSVHIVVTDKGPGIDAAHLPRLTERFYRVDSHRSRERGGTGLGLAIVKHIVNRHKGRLRIDSEVGRGASFAVLLPK